MAEKSEKATPKKLRDARKKGQVAKSQDFPAAFTFAVSLFLLVAFSHYTFNKLTGFMVAMFEYGPRVDVKGALGILGKDLLGLILAVSLPITGLVSAVGVIVNFLIIGPLFSVQAMKPDIKKLDPIQGLRQKFKMKTVVELIKSLLKITIAAIIIYFVVKGDIQSIINTAALTPLESAYVVADFLKKVAIRVGIFFLAVGVFDLAYQKRVFAKEMKMEKFEVKQEYKDIEGDPQIKGRRRQIAQEIAYDEGPRAARRAKAVVSNPEHIAVALGYEMEENPAPYILTMGVGPIADAIIRIAEEYNVPIMRNVGLARQLIAQGAVNHYIPEDTYEAVAEILRWVIALEQK
ncbi:MAG: type III secretion system export apparatus subunit SctU [Parachlamydiales bacterium]